MRILVATARVGSGERFRRLYGRRGGRQSHCTGVAWSRSGTVHVSSPRLHPSRMPVSPSTRGSVPQCLPDRAPRRARGPTNLRAERAATTRAAGPAPRRRQCRWRGAASMTRTRAAGPPGERPRSVTRSAAPRGPKLRRPASAKPTQKRNRALEQAHRAGRQWQRDQEPRHGRGADVEQARRQHERGRDARDSRPGVAGRSRPGRCCRRRARRIRLRTRSGARSRLSCPSFGRGGRTVWAAATVPRLAGAAYPPALYG